MENYGGVLLIIGVCVLVLIIGAVRSKAEWIINFVLRAVSGVFLIYFMNMFLETRYPGIGIGFGLVTFLTSGILGIPGIIMLYGINLYMLL